MRCDGGAAQALSTRRQTDIVVVEVQLQRFLEVYYGILLGWAVACHLDIEAACDEHAIFGS